MKLVNKDYNTDRLYDFFFRKLDDGKKYLELSKVFIIILILSHRVESFPKIKLYCNKTSKRIPFIVKELSESTCLKINFNLTLLRLQMK